MSAPALEPPSLIYNTTYVPKFFPGVRRPGSDPDQPPRSRAEVKNALIYLCVFTACYGITIFYIKVVLIYDRIYCKQALMPQKIRGSGRGYFSTHTQDIK
jgi:hypothetical protein